MEDHEYYRQLHNTARHYDVKMWTVLALFLAMAGLVIKGLVFENFFYEFQNGWLLLFASIASFLLLSKFITEHGLTMWIQQKINHFDGFNLKKEILTEEQKDLGQKTPLYTYQHFDKLLKRDGVEFKYLKYIPSLHQCLFRQKVSGLFIDVMFVFSVASLILGILVFIKCC